MKPFLKQLLFLFLGVSLTACSQKKETMIAQNPNINAENIVEELNKQVKHYDKETYYVFGIGNQMCFVEILINDIPVYKQFNEPVVIFGGLKLTLDIEVKVGWFTRSYNIEEIVIEKEEKSLGKKYITG